MIKANLSKLGTTISVIAGSMAIAGTASAASLTETNNIRSFIELDPIAAVRIGGKTTYETAIGINGADVPIDEQAHFAWANGVPVDFFYNRANDGVTTFTLDGLNSGGVQSTVTITSKPYSGDLSAVKLFTQAYNLGRTNAGDSTTLIVDTVNGTDIDDIVLQDIAPATEGSISRTQKYFTSDEIITSLSGSIAFAWDENGINPFETSAQSALFAKIVPFENANFIPPSPGPTPTTPEPTAVLGLLTVSALAWKRRQPA